MKKIPKKLFDDFVDISRKWWKGELESRCRELEEIAEALQKATGIDECFIVKFIDSLIAPDGFNPDAENDEIYSVLRICGWEVVDDGKE